ncbi:MAG: transcriptional regulator [Myxococcaceae bacterium]|nr:transcriptional regulator [Myxococcaceae bacterium]
MIGAVRSRDACEWALACAQSRVATTRFGDFVLDHDNRVVLRAGSPVATQRKVFECIELLASRAGQLTTLSRIREQLWPEVAVGDDAVRQVIAKARIALRVEGQQESLIRSRKGLGYVLQATLEPRAPADSRHTLKAARANASVLPALGREAELHRLRTALLAAPRGTGGLFLIAGEAGVGKSRLLQELQARCPDLPALWLEGHCQAGGAPALFWPFRELGRKLSCAAENVADGPDDDPFWRMQARTLGQLAPARKELPAGAEQRLEQSQLLCEQWSAVAGKKPLCLVLEDLHWADAGSLLLLEMLAREVGRRPLFMLATYRAEELPLNPTLQAVLGRIAGRAGVSELTLGPLDETALLALLVAVEHPTATASAARELLRLTGGNALMVQLLVRHSLESAGELPRMADSTLSMVVHERTRALPDATRTLLAQASVLGHRFKLFQLARVVGKPESHARSELEPALRAGLLTTHGESPDGFAFVHALVRDALYEALPEQTRSQLHRQALEALTGLWPGTVTSSELASHAFLAGRTVDRLHTRELCREAGRECFQTLAFERAHQHFERALALSAEGSSRRATAELSLLVARAAWHADLSVRAVSEAFTRAVSHARDANLPVLLAEAAIGAAVGEDSLFELHSARIRKDQLSQLALAYELLGEALEERTVKARVARTLCWLYGALGDREQALRWARATLAAVAELPRAEAWAQLLFEGIRCMEAVWSARPDAATAVLREMAVQMHSHQLGPRERVEARIQSMTLCLLLGEIGILRACARDLPGLIAALPDAPRFGRLGERLCTYRLVPGLISMTLATIDGDFAGAQQRLADAMAEAARLGFQALQGGDVGVIWLMPLMRYQGRIHFLEPLVEAAKDALDTISYHAALSEMALARGDLAAATRHFDVLSQLQFEIDVLGRKCSAPTPWLVSMAEVCCALERRADAERLYELLLPHESFCAVEGVPVPLGSCARALGELARALGDLARAERHLRHALARNTAMGHRPELALTQLSLARTLLELAQRNDSGAAREHAEEAQQHLAAAQQSASQLGMTTTLAAARSLSFVSQS